tara:strand:- start:2723 stop:3244 length:522 start_codon:yes stop_codon:yes gene_type:complete
MNIQQIQEQLSIAMQLDLERGVAALNELASKDFKDKYPLIAECISSILNFMPPEPRKIYVVQEGCRSHGVRTTTLYTHQHDAEMYAHQVRSRDNISLSPTSFETPWRRVEGTLVKPVIDAYVLPNPTHHRERWLTVTEHDVYLNDVKTMPRQHQYECDNNMEIDALPFEQHGE